MIECLAFIYYQKYFFYDKMDRRLFYFHVTIFRTLSIILRMINIWDKVFKNRRSKICGREPFKKLKGYCLLKQTI